MLGERLGRVATRKKTKQIENIFRSVIVCVCVGMCSNREIGNTSPRQWNTHTHMTNSIKMRHQVQRKRNQRYVQGLSDSDKTWADVEREGGREDGGHRGNGNIRQVDNSVDSPPIAKPKGITNMHTLVTLKAKFKILFKLKFIECREEEEEKLILHMCRHDKCIPL